jgi:hypothetical protein
VFAVSTIILALYFSVPNLFVFENARVVSKRGDCSPASRHELQVPAREPPGIAPVLIA